MEGEGGVQGKEGRGWEQRAVCDYRKGGSGV